ncbi:MAG: DUF4956 domain-containing protein [Tissierellia bacterium]|nr:DUF4956 domain-containing protein [Tissierellia bacterium]
MNQIMVQFASPLFMTPQEFTAMGIAIDLLFTSVMTAVLLFTYWLCHDALTFNRKFAVTLVILAYISTLLMALVQNNPLLSIGVMGSLSICRVRTNTKDARDIGFVFWAMAIGITSAVGAFLVGLISSLLLGMVIHLLSAGIQKKENQLVIVRGLNLQIQQVQELLNRIPGSNVCSQNLTAESFELVYEIPTESNAEQALIQNLNNMDGIFGVNILAPESQIVH